MKFPRILVINAGSSSLKFAVFEPLQQKLRLSGIAERIGKENARFTSQSEDKTKHVQDGLIATHRAALTKVLGLIASQLGTDTLTGIGHRVVHGGEHFRESVIINDEILTKIRSCNHLAPLHNPANLVGIEALQEQLPTLPQVAVFDTAFHQSIPPAAYTYALPTSLYQQHGLRRYGFHGTSHRYVAMKTADLLNKPLHELNLISAHLGNGCSATAIKQGKSVDTTMGLTPLEGLVMGTRSGDVDPGLLLHLNSALSYSTEDLNELLNRKSGLLGISGLSNDMRALLAAQEQGHQKASLAIEVFCYRLAKAIASLAVPAYPVDALIFTGGIGENAAYVRNKVCQQLAVLGIAADVTANQNHGRDQCGQISADSCKIKVVVVPTNEELLIAMDTNELITNKI